MNVVASGGAAWRPRDELYGNIYDHMQLRFRLRQRSPPEQPLPPVSAAAPYNNVSDLIVGAKGRSNGTDMGTKGINPYVQEHIELIDSILGAGPYVNQSMPVAESTLTASWRANRPTRARRSPGTRS